MRKHLHTDTGIAEIPSFYHGLLSCCLFCFVFLRSRKVKWNTKVQAGEFELGPPISTAHVLNLSSTLSTLKARRSKVIPQVFIGWPFASGARKGDVEAKQNTAPWDWSSSGFQQPQNPQSLHQHQGQRPRDADRTANKPTHKCLLTSGDHI